MTRQPGGGRERSRDRVTEASDWFARLRGPEGADAAVRSDFDEWQREPDNAAAYRQIEVIWNASAEVAPQLRQQRRRLRPGLIAAGLATAVTVGLLAWHNQHRNEAATVYASDRDAIHTLVLADGSRVTLDTASRVSVDFGPDERRVILLKGRARFVVAKGSAPPFVVRVGNDAVVARGTVFDVWMGRRGGEVALYEGAVDLERREARAPARLLARLRPGQKAVLAVNDAPPKIEAAETLTWPDRLIAGDALRLADVVAEANRYGQVPIVLSDPALGNMRLSGGFKLTDSRSLALLLAGTLDLDVSRRDDGALVLSRK